VFLTLRERYRLRVFENRVLRIIFGPKRDEVTGEWRKLHSGSFIICTHPHISLGRTNQEDEVGRACGTHGRGKCTKFWWRRLKERDHLEGRGIDREHGIKVDLREIGWEGVEWIHLAQDREGGRLL
jgi:hypothetical protein